MQNRIVGTTMPVLEFLLDPNESIVSEAGELSWMSGSIQMTTHTQMGGGGGLFGVLRRVAGGGTLFMTEYRAVGAPGEVGFATKVPGHILPVEIHPGHEYMVHRHGFLCGTAGVSAKNTLRAAVWVADDGTVLRQEVHLMDAKLRFERCTEPGMRDFEERLLNVDAVATVPRHAASRND